MSDYVALYRKYRPRIFSDVVGQEHVTRVLKGEIMQGAVSHAYLFCGSRGTGKTTCAKILAKAVSCENPVDGDPCGECEKCKSFENSFDIVEMDAASNNGVDDVRELKEKISFLPIEMKRRVYIIDEVHMLSVGAFNALLKTLEEPPEHVMFILATTELNKIPATILSRCKRFDFHRISVDDITRRLEFVCQKENIGIEREALRLIAGLATGAMRDALSMLELFVGRTGVTVKDAEASLGVVGSEIVLKLISDVAKRDCRGAIETVASAYRCSKDPGILCTELGNMLRDLLVMKYAGDNVSTLIDDVGEDVIAKLRGIEDEFTAERLLYCTEIVENASMRLARGGLSSRSVLELMAMRLCDSSLSTTAEALLERISALENRAVQTTDIKREEKNDNANKTVVKENAVPGIASEHVTSENTPNVKPNNESETAKEKENTAAPKRNDRKAGGYGEELVALGEIIESVKAESMILFSMVDTAKAYISDNTVTFLLKPMGCFMLKSNAEMLENLTRITSRILGFDVKLNVVGETGEGDRDEKPFPEI